MRALPIIHAEAAGVAGGDCHPVVRGLGVYSDGKRDFSGAARAPPLVLPYDHSQRGAVHYVPGAAGTQMRAPTHLNCTQMSVVHGLFDCVCVCWQHLSNATFMNGVHEGHNMTAHERIHVEVRAVSENPCMTDIRVQFQARAYLLDHTCSRSVIYIFI